MNTPFLSCIYHKRSRTPQKRRRTAIQTTLQWERILEESTEISFVITNKGNVKIDIYDHYGRWVETLLNKTLNRGHHKHTWTRPHLSSGDYTVRIETPQYTATRKMIFR